MRLFEFPPPIHFCSPSSFRKASVQKNVHFQIMEDFQVKNWLLLCLLITSSLLVAQTSPNSPQDLSTLHGQPEPPMLGIHWARGFDPFSRASEVQRRAVAKAVTMTY